MQRVCPGIFGACRAVTSRTRLVDRGRRISAFGIAASSTPSRAFVRATPIARSQSTLSNDISPRFSEALNTLNDNLALPKIPTSSLRLLSYAIQTPADGAEFQKALKRWRMAHQPQNAGDNSIFLAALFRANALQAILEILCDRVGYCVVPVMEEVQMLLDGFKARAVQLDSTEEARLAALDNVYRTFAVMLYYGIPPTSKTYSDVIEAGVYSGLEEGWRRSQITANEQLSLGMPLDAAAEAAMAEGRSRAGQ
ncbi:hypothetical protein DFS34DRAFT_627886 [Phlyctochytrium arcticum]|nr:hypothetical protein DFS34DRAFT_627886 [Phlyctochytrium arcticum]